MRNTYIRWLLPIVVVLLLATFAILTPLLASTHAASAPKTKPAITTPTPTPSHQVHPDFMWYE